MTLSVGNHPGGAGGRLQAFLGDRHKLLGAGFLLSLALHLPFVNEPPQGSHLNRQCNTLTVAWNFAFEDMDILRPRVNLREDGDGVTGMQFPSYEWGLAWLIRAFGDGHWVHRFYSLLFLFLGVGGLCELLFRLTRSQAAAALGGWTYLWGPSLFFYGFSALPDPLALAGALWGMVLFVEWLSSGSRRHFLASLVLVALGGMTKIQFLMVGVPLAVLALGDPRVRRERRASLLVFALVTTGATLGWYAYARWLIEASGLEQFGLDIADRPPLLGALVMTGASILNAIPVTLVGIPSFLLALVGAWAAWREGFRRSPRFVFWAAWAVMAAAWHWVEILKIAHHDYYLFPWIPILAALAAKGGLFLLDRKRTGWLLALLLLQPLYAGVRIIPTRWADPPPLVPAEFTDPASLGRLRRAAPDGALCVTGPTRYNAVNLYFLRKKGFRFESVQDLVPRWDGTDPLAEMAFRGATYLYLADPEAVREPFVAPYLAEKVLQEGRFEVYRLRSGTGSGRKGGPGP